MKEEQVELIIKLIELRMAVAGRPEHQPVARYVLEEIASLEESLRRTVSEDV